MNDRNFRPFFTWKDYLLGNSILAFCAQLVMGVGALAGLYAAARLLDWIP
ncbi:MAG: hypothetical protein JSR91_06345 [Proteobacteria bacterium]|nr:hypothetical protein [Pseudomonadota bacterium]